MILETIKKYRENKISAVEYDTEIMKGHRVLQEYAELLKSNMCSKIEITPEGVKCEILCNGNMFKMYLNEDDLCAVSAQILAYNEYETAESNMVVKIIKELEDNSVIFDVGANLGWYTLLMNSIKPSVSYYLFEPAKITYERLLKNIKENKIDADKCYNIGFYNENLDKEFYYDTTASGASSLVDLRKLHTTVKTSCSLIKLDDFIQEHNISRLDFIKCDVEGAELFVFQGGIHSIKKYQPIIFAEMLRKWSAKFNYHPNDILHLLYEVGYQCFVIDETNHLIEFDLVDDDTVETNYFFFHKDKHSEILKKLSKNI